MATITVEGGPSNWRDAFLDRPGLAVTPENHDRLLAEAEAAQAPEAAPEPPEAAPEVPEEAPAAVPPAPRVPPRRTPPSAPEG